MVLEKINSPNDLKKIKNNEFEILSKEIREAIIKKVNTIGGHMAPNLGIVETTIAMHYVFNSPVDKIVFDVSHQCYPHKMLTGRKEGFLNPEKYLLYTGYTAPEESEHDIFKIGHTSTSVSLATGLAKARDLKGEKYNVIALIGDGSLSGGEAFEGLDNAATLDSNIIIVVNDNDMSIAPNEGGLYKNLKLLRDTNGKAECNFFKSLGFDYYYVEEGNNAEKLIETFEKVKDTNKPTIVHVKTLKGCGLEIAENNQEAFHWVLPGVLDKKEDNNNQFYEDYTSITKDYILKKKETDSDFIVVNPATPGVFGFCKNFRQKLGKQYTDVGIAEEHAVAYCSALAKAGAKPILAVMSSFVQRAYDQISQDLCLNNSPITMLVYWGGISGADATHLCCFDIPFLSNIPNLVYLAPTNKEEYVKMLDWSVNQRQYPVAIRVPGVELVSAGVEDNTDYSQLNKFKVTDRGNKIAILGLGNFYYLGKNLKNAIKEKFGIDSTLINPRFISGIDEELLGSLQNNHDLVITLEDGMLNGGFGEKISRFYGKTSMRVLNYGSYKEFTDRVPIDELYKKYRLTIPQIIEDIENVL